MPGPAAAVADILCVIEGGRYRPGFGDNDAIGWVITIAYFLAAGLAFWAWHTERRAVSRAATVLIPRCWLVLGVLLVLLGFNKQLDLQELLTQVGREAAERQGWFEQRRKVQAAFVAGVGLCAVAAMAVAAYLLRRAWRRYLPALVGLGVTLLFILLRAATFEHVAQHVAGESIKQSPINPLFELGGLAIMSAAAIRAVRQRYAPKLVSFEKTVRIR